MSDDNVFAATPEPELVWMRHGTGVPAQFPVGSVAAWKALGWNTCDPPPEVDPALVEHQPIPVATKKKEPSRG
jgi:hypothetical protein